MVHGAGVGGGAPAGMETASVGAGVASSPQPSDAEALITPRRLPNPCLESANHQDLRRELLFNHKIGKNVLNQKSELQKALTKYKEKQIVNQKRDLEELPELERAIAERARRTAAATNGGLIGVGVEEGDGVSAAFAAARARLRPAK